MRIGTPLAMVAATVLTGVSPAGAADSARATQTLQGTWYEATEQVTETSCAQTDDVAGRWSVTLKKDGTATISLQLLIHGRLHAAWGGQALGTRATWTETAGGYVVSMPVATLTIEGDRVEFVVPDRYPTCDPTTGVVLGTVR